MLQILREATAKALSSSVAGGNVIAIFGGGCSDGLVGVGKKLEDAVDGAVAKTHAVVSARP